MPKPSDIAKTRILEIPKAIASLKTLLTGEAGRTIYLADSRDFWDDDWTYEEVEGLERQIAVAYQLVVQGLSVDWGPPVYAARHTSRGFPDWCPGLELACWSKGSRTIALWWEHQDKEVPILLVASSRAERVTAGNSPTSSVRPPSGTRARSHVLAARRPKDRAMRRGTA